jgi:hypothetical protein
MDEPKLQTLLDELRSLRAEVRSVRRWSVFCGLVLGVLIFIPRLAASIGALSETMFEKGSAAGPLVAAALGIAVVILLFGFFVSRIATPRPADAEEES